MKNSGIEPDMRRRTWSFAMTTAATLYMATALAAEPIDVIVGVLVADGNSERTIYFDPSRPDDCGTKISLRTVIERDTLRAFEGVFRQVKLISRKNDVPHGEAVIAQVVVNDMRSLHAGGGATNATSVLDADLIIEGEGKALWKKSIRLTDGYSWVPNFSCRNPTAAFKASVEAQLVKGINTALQELVDNKDILSAIEDAGSGTENRSANLTGLQALDAKYRVQESEATIRKRPDTKSPPVRKLGMGSIVQIIGKLPTGWLQVAKEGEAIGWIHEDSVTAMSVQSQPATAVATSVPTKPTKPSPAPVAAPPAPTFAAAPAPAVESFPTKPVAVSFQRAKPAPDDIAVIIGNANYKATAKDIPDVVPAYADAEGMKRYATQALGIKEENVIFIKDAKLKDMVSTFGSAENFKGKLFNWVKPQASNVFIYYSGHGAPNGDGSNSYLVPTDAEASLIDLSGYSLKTLYANLGKLPAKSVTVVLEACFSGASQSGMLVKNASPIYQKAMTETVPANLTVISAGSGNQIASWEQDKSHGLFTKHYLLGMAGAADRKPYGDGDGKVTTEELTAYLKGTMSYMAQRYYGREQTVQVATGGGK